MATKSIQDVRAMPKWVILPILLSALFHILAGGTMPHYMVGSGLSFEEEMKKQFQTVEVSQRHR